MTQSMKKQPNPEPTWTEASEPFASQAASSTRRSFSARFREHYLCFLTGEAPDSTAEFRTLGGEIPGTVRRVLHIVPLVKRSGANPFSMMITLGRAANNDIPIAFGDVSKFHGYFSQQDESWFITDAGSTNGTYLRGAKIAVRTPVQIAFGEEIGLASIRSWVLDGGALHDFLQRQIASAGDLRAS